MAKVNYPDKETYISYLNRGFNNIFPKEHFRLSTNYPLDYSLSFRIISKIINEPLPTFLFDDSSHKSNWKLMSHETSGYVAYLRTNNISKKGYVIEVAIDELTLTNPGQLPSTTSNRIIYEYIPNLGYMFVNCGKHNYWNKHFSNTEL